MGSLRGVGFSKEQTRGIARYTLHQMGYDMYASQFQKRRIEFTSRETPPTFEGAGAELNRGYPLILVTTKRLYMPNQNEKEAGEAVQNPNGLFGAVVLEISFL